MHLVADVLGLACNQLLLLALNVILFLPVIGHDELVDVLHKLLHHACLERLEPTRQEIVAGLDVVLAPDLYRAPKACHALVNVVIYALPCLRLGKQDDDHVL